MDIVIIITHDSRINKRIVLIETAIGMLDKSLDLKNIYVIPNVRKSDK